MWNNLSRVLFVATLFAGGAAAYFYNDYARLQSELEEARAGKQAISRELERYKEHVIYLTGRLDEELAKVSREKEQELARLKRAHDEMVKSLEKEIQAGQVAITRLADRLSVSIVDRVLFPSGEADITAEGRRVLERVGRALAQAGDRTIRIEGHTDNMPIGGRLQGRFPTNWELSAARATNVVRFLQEHAAIDPAALEAVGMGEHHPVAENTTPQGRSQNRRIEIILYPRVTALVKDLPAVDAPPAPKADPTPPSAPGG